MSTAELTELELDLTVPGLYLRPDYYELMARLRSEAPALRTKDGSRAITRYDDIRAISRDPARFVSSRGALINDPMRNDGAAPPNTFSILHLDPPLHATYRKIVNRQFTPRAVSGLEDSIRNMVTEAFDQAAPVETIDGVDALAARVPIAIIAEMFGIGGADREMFRIWSDAIIATPDDADALRVSRGGRQDGRLSDGPHRVAGD